MPKEVNPKIHVNERDYPIQDHHCDDPVKKKMVMKLARMITDNIPRKLPGAMHENHMDFWILDRLLTKREVAFMLSFKKRRVGLTTAELAKRNHISEEKAQKIIDHLLWIGILEQNRDNEDHHIQYCVWRPCSTSLPRSRWNWLPNSFLPEARGSVCMSSPWKRL